MPTGISTSLDASGNGNWLNPHWNGSGHSQRETLAQIQAAHLGIGDEFGRRAGKQHLAVIDDAGAIDEVERLADIMVGDQHARSEEHTSELQSLMRISYAVFCLKKKTTQTHTTTNT